MIRNLYALFIAVILFLSLSGITQAQNVSKSEGRWWWGLNGGVAWQKSDVRAKLGPAFGTTLGFGIIQNDRSAIGLMLRGRYLYSQTYGLDYKQTSPDDNPAVNSTDNPLLDYRGLPYYHNYKSTIQDLDLEVVLNTNRLRARRGINFFVFGGIGFTSYNTMLDQLDATGAQYDYSSVSSLKNLALADLRRLLDGQYETQGAGGSYNVVFAPSFGGGVNFRVARNFHIGFEHKVTYPNTDFLDGQKWNTNSSLAGHNDLYHYTNMSLQFGLFGKGKVDQAKVIESPTIDIVFPTVSTYEVKDCRITVSATARNVSRSQIEVRQNDQLITDFDFNASTGAVTITRSLNDNATFVITATNAGGSVSKSVNILCTPYVPEPTVIRPTVTITNPSANPYAAAGCNQEVAATITNIDNISSIKVQVNGSTLPPSAYSFNPQNGSLNFLVNIPQRADISIVAINKAGSGSDQVVITCKAPRVELPRPEVTVIRPAVTPFVSATCIERIVAKTKNVSDKSQIKVVVDNITLYASDFSFNPSTQEIVLNRTIGFGSMFVQFFVSTDAGTATDMVEVQCRKQPVTPVVVLPIVNITKPSADPYISTDCEENVFANIQNIRSKADINIMINGAPLSPAMYSYDQYTGNVALHVSIQQTATIVIAAANQSGSATDQVTIRCVPQRIITPVPEVIITSPSLDPFISATCEEDVFATVRNIKSKDQIRVTVNNVQLASSAYSFDPATGRVSLHVSVSQPNNIVITATNSKGTASDRVTINCAPPKEKVAPPTVQILTPVIDPYISVSCEEDIVATVRNIKTKDGIQVFINDNAPLSANLYSFDPTTGQLSFHLSIKQNNSIVIKATNESGTASDKVTINCAPPKEKVPPPTVQITSPTIDPYISVTCQENVVATVRNVKTKDKIQVLVNSNPLSADLLTFDAVTGRLSFPLTITQITSVEIVAVNESGSATDKVTISCAAQKEKVPAPTVQIKTPAVDPYVSVTCEEDIVATVRNVKTKDGIQILVNSLALASDQFTFEPATGKVTFHVSVKQTSEVLINATNESGTASDKVTIGCAAQKEKLPAPTVQITSPAIDPFISVTCEEDVVATVRNITSKDNIHVLINNAVLPSDQFTFDAVSGRVAFHVSLKATNNISITATNESGTASDKITISCAAQKEKVPAPTVQITYPTIDPYISVTCQEDIIATVRNITSKANIVILVNTVPLEADQFTFDPVSGKIAMHVSVKQTNSIVITATNESGAASDKATISCATQKDKVPAPTVQITSPAIDPYISTACSEGIKATVRNVVSKDNIQVAVNTVPLVSDQYTFDPVTGILRFSVEIKQASEIVVTATNESGTASDKITVSCAAQKEKVPAPTVQITSPSVDPYISVSCEENITATVRNVKAKENIHIVINSLPLTTDQFAFDATSGRVTFALSIKEPSAVVITASNETGVATDRITISCAPPKEKVPAPTVQVTKPGTDPYISVGCEEDVIATVRNVKSKEGIEVSVNNVALTPDKFIFDPGTGQVSFHVSVKTPNTIVITATNESGTASDRVTISCAPPKEKTPEPTVQISKPSVDPYISVSCEEDVVATVRNVKSKENIKVIINSLPLTSDAFTFDAVTGQLSFHVSVKEPNAIVITATNESGVASDKVSITCAPPKETVPPPTVQISKPSADPFVSVSCEEDVVATVRNVKSKSDVKITVNNTPLTADQYAFEASTGQLNFHLSVKNTSLVVISVTNESGTASDKVTINCVPKEEEIVIPPFDNSDNCPAASPSPYVDCSSCHKADDNGVTSLSVESGKKVCIRGNFSGQITMNGGTLVICGKATPSSLNFNSGTIVINGSATFPSLNLNNSSCTVRNFGTLAIQGTTFNGRMENYGTMTVSGSDLNVNSQGVFKNTGTLTVSGGFNNSNKVCNSGTINVSKSVHNNGNATFINSCKVIAANEFHNNGYFDNSAYVKAGTKAFINGGSTFKMSDGSQLVTTNLDFAGTISGGSGACASVSVSGQSTVNGGASLTGKVNLCDANGIEQNNTGGAVKSTCDCTIQATDCVEGIKAAEKEKTPAPVVTINTPSATPFTSTDCEEEVIAVVKNVSAKSDIKITVNNIVLTADRYAYEVSTGRVILKVAIDKSSEVVITATNESGTATDKVVLNCTPPKVEEKKPTFEIDKGTVKPHECSNANVTVLGCALKEGGVGMDYPVIVQVNFGGKTIDPFGAYSGYNKASDVNDHKQHSWDSDGPIPANTAISVKAKSINPKTGSLLYERNSSGTDPFVRVLKNGDPMPQVSGFAGQADAKSYMAGYIVNGKLKLEANQAIYLFELGTNSTTSKSNDMQDCVVLVTLTPASASDCSGAKLPDTPKENDANDKVTICHYPPGNTSNPQTLTISKSALQAHLDHGDHVGPCTEADLNKAKKEKEEADRKAKEEADRIAREKAEADKKAREEADRVAREKAEADRIAREKAEADKKAKEEADKAARDKAEADRIAREKAEEEERIRKEKEANEKVTICHFPPGNTGNPQTLTISKSALQAHLDHGDHIGPCTDEEINATKEKEEAERQQREKAEAEKKAKEEADKAARDKAEADRIAREKAEADKKAREEADRVAREKAEADRVAREKAEADKQAKEEADRVAREKAEADKAAREKAEEDRKAKEEADKAANEKAEADRIAREKAEADRKAKEEADKAAREKAEADRLKHEQEEHERQQKMKEEQERQQREKAEADKQKQEQEEQERQQKAKEKEEADRVAREKAEADKQKHEQEERERQQKAKAEQERLQREKEKAEKEKEEGEKEKKEEKKEDNEHKENHGGHEQNNDQKEHHGDGDHGDKKHE